MFNKDKLLNRIGLVSCPMGRANIQPFISLIKIISHIDPNANIIAVQEKEASIIEYRNFPNTNIIIIIHESSLISMTRILNYAITQIKISFEIIFCRDVKTWIFYIDNGLILPIIISKVLRKNIFILLGGFQEREISIKGDYLDKFSYYLTTINRNFCDKIIIYSPRLITDWKLESYINKIFIAHEHILDFSLFHNDIKLSSRPQYIGFIGRLSEEKGIINFIKALPIIIKSHDIRVMIGGSGPLFDEVKTYLKDAGISEFVDLLGWIHHDELPKYLCSLRLLIIPSFTEGLPNIMLEAMASGTPVLATPVGAIPDIIIDKKTGFIMENNSPPCIAKNVKRVFSFSNLENIAYEGKKFVLKNYSFEKTLEKWNEIF